MYKGVFGVKKIIKSYYNNAYWIIFLIISFGLSIIISILNFKRIISPGLDIIQHLLTVSSIVLGIITLNLTIILSIREGKVYKTIKEKHKNLLSQLFGYATSAIVSSASVIFVSLLILSTKHYIYSYLIYKIICILFLSTSFLNMIMDTAMSFFQNIQLLKLDDEQ